MGLVISKGLTLRNDYRSAFADPDVQAYLSAVEQADGQALEYPVAYAVDEFVRGCKADGIWNAIKASCILAGARTLNGALTPLVGTAPTNVGGLFVSADYNRKTGLVGDGSTKYLDSNRNNNADPQNSKHVSVWISTSSTVFNFARILAAGDSSAGDTGIVTAGSAGSTGFNLSLNNLSAAARGNQNNTGFTGMTRSSSANFQARTGSANFSVTATSVAPRNENIRLYKRPEDFQGTANARLAFYSIGEALDLALLDARVTDLINAFGAAIP